jgi:hypothetical protein
MLRVHLLPAVALAGFAASSFASTTTYNSSASFLSNVAPGSYTETFTDFDDSGSGPSLFAGNGFSYTIFAPSDLYASGEFAGTNLPNEALTVTFTSGNVTAVGGNFYTTNISDVFQAVSVTLGLSDGTSVSFTPSSVFDSYRGFTSSVTITSLVMSAPGISLYAGIDNLTVGVTAVPEPASWALMALGVVGLLAARRRSV